MIGREQLSDAAGSSARGFASSRNMHLQNKDYILFDKNIFQVGTIE
jgi:hypothetical protein